MSLRQLNLRNQITLPSAMLSQMGVRGGDYFDIHNQDGYIVLKPVNITQKEDDITLDEWDKLEKLIEAQLGGREFTEYNTIEGAAQHLKKRLKKNAD